MAGGLHQVLGHGAHQGVALLRSGIHDVLKAKH
jgi:hypothetical protein